MAFLRVTKDVDDIPVARLCQMLGALYLYFFTSVAICVGASISNFFLDPCGLAYSFVINDIHTLK